jgi:prolyl oligopeptidase
VHPGHARKTAKKLLDYGQASTLYYENIEGGHGGAADSSQRAFMKTVEYEFLWKTLHTL